jgi:protein phosphatase
MQHAVPMIYCPNLRCRAPSPEGEPVCQKCGTSIPQRYLWVADPGAQPHQVGDCLADRYQFKSAQVVLDTQPGLPLSSAFDITDNVLPYLKLFPVRLHLPQLYSLLKVETSTGETDVLTLLESAPLIAADFCDPTQPLPDQLQHIAVAEIFTEAWREAPVLRQVQWLWQMVQIWEPLQREGVAWSLINPDLLRVEGPLLRLLSLEFNPRAAPSLPALGEFWTKWCLPYVGQWRTKFSELCDRLINKEIPTIEALSAELEAWLTIVRRSSQVKIDIATRTDSGPSRDQNEDACYPHGGMVLQNATEGLMVVCDGVGGHAGGEVASGIAIAVLTEHLQQMPLAQLTAEEIMEASEAGVSRANDLIVKQNDQENRHDRDRMGTTVVMALASGHDLYLTNLGDSRAYLITPQGCYQITTDDDIATREVRLGYLPYRDAIRQPGSGSLIQALGMVPSSMLRPSVQRFTVDSDCLFLLCSDGLSDFERIESLWQQHLLPLLSGEVDLAETTKILIAEANRLNGHDNVTIGLLHYRVQAIDPSQQPTQVEKPQTWSSPPPSTQGSTVGTAAAPKRSVKTPGQRPFWMTLGLLTLFGGGGIALGLLLWPKSTSVSTSPVPTAPVIPPTPSPEPTLDTKNYWTVRRSLDNSATPSTTPPLTLDLKAAPSVSAPSIGLLANGIALKITGNQKNADQTRWFQVKVCGRLPAPLPPSGQPLPESFQSPHSTGSDQSGIGVKPGVEGYLLATTFQRAGMPLEPAQVGTLNLEGCAAATASPLPSASSPTPKKPTP